MTARRSSGFTLIEVLAAVFLTAVVMTIAINFFIQLSDATDAAAAKARDGRRALAVIDRVARDLEAAYLRAKPEEADPLAHPWYFVAANAEGGEGADRVQFITRNHRPRNRLGHGSDLALVTWLLQASPDGPGYQLLRAVEPGLPSAGPGDFLSANDDRFMVVAENVEHFGMRFMGEEREWSEEWDSSQVERSGLLPLAAEIEIAYLREVRQEDAFDDFGELVGDVEEGVRFARHVVIPMRAVDVDQMLKDAQEAAANADRRGAADTTRDDLDDLDDEDLERLLEDARSSGRIPEDQDPRGR